MFCNYLGYASITNIFPNATSVNHSIQFVNSQAGSTTTTTTTTTTTNTIEGMHGVFKSKAKKLNLFSGQPAKCQSLERKVDELVYRLNHRHLSEDFFVLFLHLLSVYYPCCSDQDIEARLSKISLFDETSVISVL